MAITDKNTIYSWFQNDDFPTEAQFRATWDSFWHKSETIPVSQINGLNELFQQTATITQLNQKANKDGSNIDVAAYKFILGITDPNLKADLVGGKVPKNQSQPSTMVMNNSTYVITFTDATGAVQTIDLPLESLFKDANYDEQTKSLIITLDNGTTKSIPLTDLVDLPEIVLSATNPAVTPTSGQKVYFNTSSGKAWFNVGGAWAYAGNLMTDAEKTKLANTSGTNTGDETGASITTKLGFTPENSSNKSTDILSNKTSNSKFPSVKAVYEWSTNELNKKVAVGSDTVFSFKNISAMSLSQFKTINPNLETIYFTEEQNATGWQSLTNDLGNIIAPAGETQITFADGESVGDSSFSLINLTNGKINGIFEKDFLIIKFKAGVVTPNIANQWFKIILKINNVNVAVSPVFYLLESAGTIEQITHNFAINVTPELLTNGAFLFVKTSNSITFQLPEISVLRVHKSTNAIL